MPSLFTIGHSNREITDFLALLAENEIAHIADVRRFPGSRRYPQFGRDALAASLATVNIGYTPFPLLGGRRTNRNEESSNSAWRIIAFAAYADYMLTDEFASAFAELCKLAENTRTAVMCAEALPWRCHRRLIADQFLAHDWQVYDIIGPHNTKPHELPPFARIAGGRLTYPGEPSLF